MSLTLSECGVVQLFCNFIEISQPFITLHSMALDTFRTQTCFKQHVQKNILMHFFTDIPYRQMGTLRQKKYSKESFCVGSYTYRFIYIIYYFYFILFIYLLGRGVVSKLQLIWPAKVTQLPILWSKFNGRSYAYLKKNRHIFKNFKMHHIVYKRSGGWSHRRSLEESINSCLK